MELANEEKLTNVDVKGLSVFTALSGIAMFLPFFIHLQWITGPIVNAVLIIVLFIVGIRSALILCLVPSLMALAGGLLPAVLAPIVPFIMISNVIYIISIDWIYNYAKQVEAGYWFGIALGSILKFIFIFISVTFIVKLLTKQEFIASVSKMMVWPQLVNALAGGIIAWAVLKWLKRV